MKRTLTLAIPLAFILHPTSFLLAQGSLTPPGAPAPTMKTLDQLDAKLEKRTPISAVPFTISANGSYYVTGNLTGVAGQHGITIDADHVTLDLGGFDLAGPGSGAATNGIRVINSHTDATIRNGSVHGCLGAGVAAETSANADMNLEYLRVTGNGLGGIVLGTRGTALHCDASNNSNGHGIATSSICKVIECTASGNTGVNSDGINLNSFSLVRDCVVVDNGADGIEVGNGCVLTGCVAENSIATGFKGTASGCTVRDCTAQGCGTVGFSGFVRSTLTNCAADSNISHGFGLGTGCALANCSASLNTGIGFATGVSTTLDNCSAASNTGPGFNCSDANTLHNCSAYNNGGNGFTVTLGGTLGNCTAKVNAGAFGISTTSACTLIGCTVRASTSALATSAGINTGTECLVSQCVVSNVTSTAGTLTSTTGMGINTGGSCTIERCVVQGCKGDGIRATSACLIRDNLSDSNGATTGDGAGIHTVSSGNRIEGNTVKFNDRGIDVDSIGSLIIKNSASGNTTDYDIAASNRYGPILFIPGSGTAAVSGSSAASTLTSTDPWANFSF